MLRPDEKPECGVRRDIVGAIDDCLSLRDDGTADRVHAWRVGCKRIRAWLHLLRPGLGEARFHQENQCFRDIGRQLRGRRDADVLRDVWSRVHRDLPALGAPAVKRVDAELQRLETAEADIAPVLVSVAQNAWAARLRLRSATLSRLHWKDLSGLVGRSYGRSHKLFRIAHATRDTVDLHAWRKQLKRLTYQLELLDDASAGARRAGKTLKRLTRRLGDALDADAFSRRLDTLPPFGAADRARLASDLQKAVDTQTEQAFSTARRLYRLSPDEFNHHLRDDLHRWRDRPQLDPDQRADSRIPLS